MSQHRYQIWYNGTLASVHLTRYGAQREIGQLVLKGYTGKFELKEGCLDTQKIG